MALRVSGGRAPEMAPEEELPIEETLPEEDLAAELPVELTSEEPAAGGGVLDPLIAGYKGPEVGPFACGNCVHFSPTEVNTCAIVAGFIDEGGICNVFSPSPTEEEAPIEEPMTEELPEELPAEEAPIPEEEILA